jgi:hypothetical protein
MTAFAVSTPASAEHFEYDLHDELIEEVVVNAYRPGAPRVNAFREQLKLEIEALLDSIERDEAQKASERSAWTQVRFGYDPEADSGPLIDEERQQVAMSFVRPATIISIGF